MNVANQLQKIIIAITKDRLVTTLEEVSNLAVAPVEVKGITLLKTLHELGEGIAPPRNEKVDMIGHETTGMNGNRISFGIETNLGEIMPKITSVQKNPLPVVAPRYEMVEMSFEVMTWATGH